jgi:hypothetical protein
MHADIWPHRIDIHVDISEANSLSQQAWDPLLNDLKAESVPPLTPAGERTAVIGEPDGRMHVIVYRTTPMSDEEVTRVLAKYRIRASVRSEESGPT